MRYDTAIEKLFALQARGVRMGIDRMRDALHYRHYDVHCMPFIQVAGTNGKGSVCAMIASSLEVAGHRTGLFTSPHLHRFTERVRIDGEVLGTREAARRISELLEVFGRADAPQVTFFELSTLLALEAFRDHGCDVAVLEVGLGGRLDATNALPAKLTVITRIALDHMQYLGHTLAKIAGEKAGIIKHGVPVIVGTREPAALRVIAARAKRLRAPAVFIDQDFAASPVRAVSGRGAQQLRVRTPQAVFAPVRLALAGEHQQDNAACAVAALAALPALGLPVSRAAVLAGPARVRWPARMERIAGRPAFLLDAAHNPDGCQALARYLAAKATRSKQRRVLVFGVMSDKDYTRMLQILAPCFDYVLYAPPNMQRAASLPDLQHAHAGQGCRDVGAALRRAKRLSGPSGLVVVAGSIFVVAQARARLLGLPSDPLIRM
ncbi:MAG TPA: folylpolyglutamate synthase/dihydrofolate synthase family protein [Polyangiales bacterium]